MGQENEEGKEVAEDEECVHVKGGDSDRCSCPRCGVGIRFRGLLVVHVVDTRSIAWGLGFGIFVLAAVKTRSRKEQEAPGLDCEMDRKPGKRRHQPCSLFQMC